MMVFVAVIFVDDDDDDNDNGDHGREDKDNDNVAAHFSPNPGLSCGELKRYNNVD